MFSTKTKKAAPAGGGLDGIVVVVFFASLS
jgi:hypothetical protein